MRSEPLNGRGGGRLVSASAERNKVAVAQVLKELLPDQGVVLEVSSGSGQHVVHFAREMPALTWQPSECAQECLPSIAQWVADESLTNVRPALRLDVTDRPWPLSSAAAVVCLNMIHIAPWHVGEALVVGASEVLAPGGVFFLYGPFRRNGQHTSASNEAFDSQLRARNPAWGVRNLEDVARCAAAHDFGPPEIRQMPANNLCVFFRRR